MGVYLKMMLADEYVVFCFTAGAVDNFLDICYFMLISFVTLQELQSSVSDIVEDILKMHDTTKVRPKP